MSKYAITPAFTDATRPNFEPKGRIWAPDINKIGDKYVMYYSMSTWGGEWTCGIGIATADKPEGPFTDLGKLFRSRKFHEPLPSYDKVIEQWTLT